MLAVQADGAELQTVEGLARSDGGLHPIQEAFIEKHGLQCGFCTPGFLMTTLEFLGDTRIPATRRSARPWAATSAAAPATRASWNRCASRPRSCARATAVPPPLLNAAPRPRRELTP